MWPYICKYVEKLFRDTVEPAVKESSAHLSTFRFSRIDIGDKVSIPNGNIHCIIYAELSVGVNVLVVSASSRGSEFESLRK